MTDKQITKWNNKLLNDFTVDIISAKRHNKLYAIKRKTIKDTLELQMTIYYTNEKVLTVMTEVVDMTPTNNNNVLRAETVQVIDIIPISKDKRVNKNKIIELTKDTEYLLLFQQTYNMIKEKIEKELLDE